jgi:propanediol dehydratase small subunit
MNTVAIVIALLFVAPAIWISRNGAPLPKPFRSRPCQGAGWRRAFPMASKQEIRDFLLVFMEAFVFDRRQKLKFHPNDSILSVYRAGNPHKWQPDGLELEQFELSVEKTYGVRLSEVWRESLTLGELFDVVQSTKRNL